MADAADPTMAGANVTTVATFYKAPPVFSDQINYDRWINELKFWDKMTKIEKKEKGLAVALSLPLHSDIRDKVFTELTVDELNVDDGLEKLILFLDRNYKKEEIAEVYNAWSTFDLLARKNGETMEHYLREFDKCQKKIKKHAIEMPNQILGFQLLAYSGLSQSEKQIVLTGVDYGKKDTVYEQMVLSIKKFFGDQMIPGNVTIKSENQAIAIKQEPVMENNHDAFYAGNRNVQKYNESKGYRSQPTDRRQNLAKPRLNPVNGYTGKPYRCHSCRSEYHFIRDCPVKERYQPRKTYEAEATPSNENNE